METSNENINLTQDTQDRPQKPTAKQYKARQQSATKTVSEWIESTVLPLKGEILIGIPDEWDGESQFKPIVKVGDGVHYWAELEEICGSSAGVEVLIKTDNTQSDEEFIRESLDPKKLVDGLYVIVESEIEFENEDGTTKTLTQHTAYTYVVSADDEEGTFKALSGNYNADNVYFDSDITLAGDYTAVGNVKLNEGTLQSKGKSISELFDQIFTKELEPAITQPSLTITLGSAGSHEVGTILNPTYKINFNKGSYQYGPETGVTVTSSSATFNGETLTGLEGTFSQYIVQEGNKQATATASYSDGVFAKTNLGNTSATAKITAGSCNNSSSNITGVRYSFWKKNSSDVNVSNLTSDTVRGYTKFTGNKLTISTVGAGVDNIIIALPSSKTISKVIMPVSNNADVTSEFKLISSTVSVSGANGNLPISYNIYKYRPASLDAISNFEITIV